MWTQRIGQVQAALAGEQVNFELADQLPDGQHV